MRSKEKGFTIIELLMVIAIISLLSSIILASVSGSRQKAKTAKSLEFSQSLLNRLGAEAVGIWGFEDCGGDGNIPSTLTDASGYGNNGTNNGATCRADTPYHIIGQGTGRYALSFDGGDDYVDAGNAVSLNITNAITIEAWVKLTQKVYEPIVSKRNPVTDSYLLTWDVSIPGFGFYGASNSGWVFTTTYTGTVNLNEWYHLVGVYEANQFSRLYLNGQQVDEDTTVGQITLANYNWNFGRREYGSQYFNGLIDEVRIYNQALTQAQIQKQYAEGLERHQDLEITSLVFR